MVAVRDFNAKSSKWYNKCTNISESRKTKALTSQNGLHQKINKLAHILNNSPSYIDFIFDFQANLLIESSFHPPFHQSYHH